MFANFFFIIERTSPPLCEVSWKNANLYLEAGEGGLFDLGLLIEKQTRVPTEFYDDRSIEDDFKSNSESGMVTIGQ